MSLFAKLEPEDERVRRRSRWRRDASETLVEFTGQRRCLGWKGLRTQIERDDIG